MTEATATATATSNTPPNDADNANAEECKGGDDHSKTAQAKEGNASEYPKKRALASETTNDNDNGSADAIDTSGGNDTSNVDTDQQPSAKKARTEETSKPCESAPSSAPAPAPTKSIFGSSTTSGFAAFGGDAKSIFGSSSHTGSTTTADDDKPVNTSVFGSSSSSTMGSIFGRAHATGFGPGAGAGAGAGTGSITSTGSTSTAKGFGSSPSSASTGIFGSGTTASTTVFTLSDKDKDKDKDHDNASDSSPFKSDTSAGTTLPIASLPISDERITNGEENEETIITLRAKLFKLTKVAIVHKSMEKKKVVVKKVGIQMATKVGEQDQEHEQEEPANHAAAHTGTAGSSSATANAHAHAHAHATTHSMDWKEVGIGPLRVLTDDRHARIVQRRETTPGGQGTKLILNLPLREECRVERRGDKFVRLAAFEIVEEEDEDLVVAVVDNTTTTATATATATATTTNTHTADDEKKKGEQDVGASAVDGGIKFAPVQYLFKVKTVAEADSLLETLKKYCGDK